MEKWKAGGMDFISCAFLFHVLLSKYLTFMPRFVRYDLAIYCLRIVTVDIICPHYFQKLNISSLRHFPFSIYAAGAIQQENFSGISQGIKNSFSFTLAEH